MTVWPSAASQAITSWSRSVSSAVSDDVGSSMMMTRAFRAIARMISTFCRSAIRRSRTVRDGERRHQLELLVDHRDAVLEGTARGPVDRRLAEHLEAPGVERIVAADD